MSVFFTYALMYRCLHTYLKIVINTIHTHIQKRFMGGLIQQFTATKAHKMLALLLKIATRLDNILVILQNSSNGIANSLGKVVYSF